MKLKVRIDFVNDWSSIIPEVAKQCNMSVEEYCKRAVMLITKQGLEAGQEASDVESSEAD